MATWRRKDLERRSGERNRRIGRVMRAEILIPALALVIAGVALWQAMAAQSRADVLAHDLSIATGQLRDTGSYSSAAPTSRPSSEEGAAANPPLPPLPPMGAAPSQTSPASAGR